MKAILLRSIIASGFVLHSYALAQNFDNLPPPDPRLIDVAKLGALAHGCDAFCARKDAIAQMDGLRGSDALITGQAWAQCQAYNQKRKAEKESTGLLALDTAAAAACATQCAMTGFGSGRTDITEANGPQGQAGTSKRINSGRLGYESTGSGICTTLAIGAAAAEVLSLLKIKGLDLATPVGEAVSKELLFPRKIAPIEIAGWHPSLFERASSVTRFVVENIFVFERAAFAGHEEYPASTQVKAANSVVRVCGPRNPGSVNWNSLEIICENGNKASFEDLNIPTRKIGNSQTTEDNNPNKNRNTGSSTTTTTPATSNRLTQRGPFPSTQGSKPPCPGCTTTPDGYLDRDPSGNTLADRAKWHGPGAEGIQREKDIQDYCKSVGGTGTRANRCVGTDGKEITGPEGSFSKANVDKFVQERAAQDQAIQKEVALQKSYNDDSTRNELLTSCKAAIFFGALAAIRYENLQKYKRDRKKDCENVKGLELANVGSAVNPAGGNISSSSSSGTIVTPPITQPTPTPTPAPSSSGDGGTVVGSGAPSYDGDHHRPACWRDSERRIHCRDPEPEEDVDGAVESALAATAGPEIGTFSDNGKFGAAIQNRAAQLDITAMLANGNASSGVLAGMAQLGFSAKGKLGSRMVATLDFAQSSDWSDSSGLGTYVSHSTGTSYSTAVSSGSGAGTTAAPGAILGDGFYSGDATSNAAQAAFMASKVQLEPKPGEADIYHVNSPGNIFQIVSEKIIRVNDRIK